MIQKQDLGNKPLLTTKLYSSPLLELPLPRAYDHSMVIKKIFNNLKQ